ncbi:hypothetical protein [Desulfonema ishimotonii]|nr:hypothetical protein [Desulfonema ishimotonii]
MEDLQVECYSGYRGEETPRCFRLGQNRIGIRKVLDRWLSPDHRYFKVVGDDNAVYILRHDTVSWRWSLTFYKQRKDGDEQ